MKEKVLLNVYRVLSLLLVGVLVYSNKDRIANFINKNDVEDVKEISESVETVMAPVRISEEKQEEAILKVDASKSATYIDERVPDYSIINGCVNDPVTLEYTWTSFEGLYYATICYSIDAKLYEYFNSLSRYYGNSEYKNYINDPINSEYLDMLVENLNEIGDKRGYTDGERVREVISFCQSFEYETDQESTERAEWPKYPIELLYDRVGDCEDTALLLVGILSKMGYGCALIKFDDHIAVGLKGDQSIDGTYFENNGIKYYYIETTNRGWRIGEIPDEYVGLPATVIVIS
ncbi:MAG: hypothetical protein K6A97_09680 [Lachnospiraceae bacterium]|nr:hypothetical protein [Lachnospiraceae bacterium]